jgi:hypothetical protein
MSHFPLLFLHLKAPHIKPGMRCKSTPGKPDGSPSRRIICSRSRLLQGAPAIFVLPVPSQSVDAVPLIGIKSKKIPIVQPNLTFLIEKMQASEINA